MPDRNTKEEIDLEAVRAFLKNKEDALKDRLGKKWETACADFDRIVSLIISKYNPSRIYQWGSLIRPENFSEISDIDIGLEGIKGPEEYFAILGDAMDLTSFPIDIIELDKIDPADAEHIRKKGRLVYERKDD
jgi:predicted nucleotidyltransferase